MGEGVPPHNSLPLESSKQNYPFRVSPRQRARSGSLSDNPMYGFRFERQRAVWWHPHRASLRSATLSRVAGEGQFGSASFARRSF